MEFKLQDSEKNVIFQPLYDSRDENKISKTFLHIYKTYPSIPYHLSTTCIWNLDGVQVTLAQYERNRHLSTLILPQGVKWKFQILTAHLQDMPNHILENQLSTSENVNKVQVTNFNEKKKSRFSTIIWPPG